MGGTENLEVSRIVGRFGLKQDRNIECDPGLLQVDQAPSETSVVFNAAVQRVFFKLYPQKRSKIVQELEHVYKKNSHMHSVCLQCCVYRIPILLL